MLHNIRIDTRLLTEDDLNAILPEDPNPEIDEAQTPAEIKQIRRNYIINNFTWMFHAQ